MSELDHDLDEEDNCTRCGKNVDEIAAQKWPYICYGEQDAETE